MTQKISDKIEIITDEALGILHDLATINVTDMEKVEAVMSSMVSRAGKIVAVGTMHRYKEPAPKVFYEPDYDGFFNYVRKNLIGVKIYKDTWEETFNPILDRCHVVRKNSIRKYVKKDIKTLLLKAFDIEEGHGTTRTERRAYIIIKEKEEEIIYEPEIK